jgi:hypothetical protein
MVADARGKRNTFCGWTKSLRQSGPERLMASGGYYHHIFFQVDREGRDPRGLFAYIRYIQTAACGAPATFRPHAGAPRSFRAERRGILHPAAYARPDGYPGRQHEKKGPHRHSARRVAGRNPEAQGAEARGEQHRSEREGSGGNRPGGPPARKDTVGKLFNIDDFRLPRGKTASPTVRRSTACSNGSRRRARIFCRPASAWPSRAHGESGTRPSPWARRSPSTTNAHGYRGYNNHGAY